jgi:hypothetical protein
MSKKAKDEKPKGKKGKGPKIQSEPGLSVANHPRASAQIRRAKGLGGIAGFVIAAYLSLKANVPFEIGGLRALGAGVIGYMLAWGAAVSVWRHLVMAELRALVEQRLGPVRHEVAHSDSAAE